MSLVSNLHLITHSAHSIQLSLPLPLVSISVSHLPYSESLFCIHLSLSLSLSLCSRSFSLPPPFSFPPPRLSPPFTLPFCFLCRIYEELKPYLFSAAGCLTWKNFKSFESRVGGDAMEKGIETNRLSEERWDVSWTEKFFHLPISPRQMGVAREGVPSPLHPDCLKKQNKTKRNRTHSEWLCELIITGGIWRLMSHFGPHRELWECVCFTDAICTCPLPSFQPSPLNTPLA